MDKQPCLSPLHPIETASLDELRATQLERMKELGYGDPVLLNPAE